MAYTPKNWVTDELIIEADLDHIEQGILAADSAAAAALPKSLVDAKGDLIVASANDTPGRLPLGTDGQVLVADAAQALGIKWAPAPAGGSSIDYENVWSAAVPYTAGDVVVYNGVQYLAVNPSTGSTPAPLGGATVPVPVVGIGTSLPASPSDGDEFILVDSLTAPTYQWRFRYVASITDAYKWISVGPVPAFAEVVAAQDPSSTAFVDLATVGPSFTVPRAGIYEIEIGSMVSRDNESGRMSFAIGATAAVDTDGFMVQGVATVIGAESRVQQKTITAAATAIVTKYRNIAGSITFSNRYLRVIPLRVA